MIRIRLLIFLAAVLVAVLAPGLLCSQDTTATGPGSSATAAAVESWQMDFRRVLVSASGLVYWGGVWIQARRIRRKIGRTPNLRPRGTKERLLWLGWTVVIIGWIAQPFFVSGRETLGSLFGPSPALIHPAGLIAGTLIVVLGYLGTLWCYAAMGAAWRIGIDTEGSSSLVQAGPYRRMRHPIYSFQMFMLVGAAILLPTPVSLAILVLHFTCASIKASDEERHLTGIHGDDYREYLKRSGRFLPRIF